MEMSTIAAQPRIIGRVAPVRPARNVNSARPRATVRPVPVRPSSSRPAPVRAAAASRSAGRLHLTRRGRAVAVLLGLLLVVAGVMGGRAVAEGPQQATEVQTYAVQSGDTLWTIAQGVAKPGEDVRDVVIQLQRLNSLDSGSLLAGQVLMLPVAP